jgi:hypothetical protein
MKPFYEHTMIKSGLIITMLHHERSKLLIPLSWTLLQPIQTLFLHACFSLQTLQIAPCRSSHLTSFSTSRFKFAAKLSTNWIEDISTIGEKIFLKSIPFF